MQLVFAFLVVAAVAGSCIYAGVWSYQALIDEGNDIANGTLSGVTVHLYSNNVTPTTSSVIGDFTECGFGGYVSQAIGVVTLGAIVGDTQPISNAGLTWTSTGGGTNTDVYGYYLTDSLNRYLGAEKFTGTTPPTPWDMSVNGAVVGLQITENLIRV